MTDERICELERRWRVSGTLQAEAELHVERVRSGLLQPERLRLAAYLGHPAAIEALRGQAIPGPDLPAMLEALGAKDEGTAAERMALMRRRHQARQDVDELLAGLEAFGKEVCLRAAMAVVALLLPRFRWARDPDLLHRSFDAVMDWLRFPSDERALACARLAVAITPAHNDSGFTDRAVKLLASSASDARGTSMALDAIRAAGGTRLEHIQAIREDLIPFALGFGDPVRERVEAREREAGGHEERLP